MKDRHNAIKARSNRINFVFIILAAVILATTLWYSRILISKIAEDERLRVQNWATTVQRQAEMVNYVRTFFAKLEVEERKYATVWSYAYERLLSSTTSPEEFDYFIKIISGNETIPFVVVDENNRIIETTDPSIDLKKDKYLRGKLMAEYSVYPPITMDAEVAEYQFYYKPSKLFLDLRRLLNDLSRSFNLEIVDNIVSVPVIITDSTRTNVINYGNVDDNLFYSNRAVQAELDKMALENPPIGIEALGSGSGKSYIFYESSTLLKNMQYFPIALFLSLLIIIIGIIFLFNLARRTEQNQVWVGMSKETAHQLGTPLSSLLAWLEYYKLKLGEPMNPSDLEEMGKDVDRIQVVTNRFSKIGSVPELKTENIVPLIYKSISYLQARSSKKVKYSIDVDVNQVILVQMNASLFEWVIENIYKNALNAIGDQAGEINITVIDSNRTVSIDIQDTGKGMAKNILNKIFEPGFTTKTRGWGVGLTLCKRIVSDYHGGKIFVKSSTPGVGTTFRIILNKEV
ncbi:MAG: HAMP domain-containing sensor histidine kinase [Bacteroidales bacterium]